MPRFQWMCTRMTALAAALVAAAPRPLGAQRERGDSLPVAPGARVRLTIVAGGGEPRSRVVGRWVGQSSATLSLSASAAGVREFPRGTVERVEVSRGRARGRGALRGAGLGLLAGAAVGAWWGAAVISEGNDCYQVCSRGAGAVVGAVLLGVPGAVIGTVAGTLTAGERWRRVDGARLRVGLGPARDGGATVALRLSF